MNYFSDLQNEFEVKSRNLIRRVRTPAGAAKYGQPIGTVIVPDPPLPKIDLPSGARQRPERAARTPQKVVGARLSMIDSAKTPTSLPDGAEEVETDYEGTRKFRLGRRVFYTWQEDSGTWVLTDAKDNVLHEGNSEDEALKGLEKYIPKKPATPRNEAGKKVVGGYRPATQEDLDRTKEVHGVLVPAAYKGSAMVPEQENQEPVLKWVDDKGRVQPGYSKAHHERAKRAKFQRIKELTKQIKKLDAYLDANWSTEEAAAVLLLIRKTGMRPSSADNATGAVVSFGATTIQARHVTINQNSVRLKFDGKKGVGQDHTYRDQQLVELFKLYKGDKTHRSEVFENVTDHQLNFLIKQVTGGDFKTKDLRTLLATSEAVRLVAAHKRPALPKTKTEFRKWRNEVGDKVSEKLGNTRTMALGSYIDPGVFDAWEKAVED